MAIGLCFRKEESRAPVVEIGLNTFVRALRSEINLFLLYYSNK